jgi:hypothetical protein
MENLKKLIINKMEKKKLDGKEMKGIKMMMKEKGKRIMEKKLKRVELEIKIGGGERISG